MGIAVTARLTTDRLRLRPLGPGDIADLAALHSDPRVMLGRTGVAVAEHRSQTETWLDQQLAVRHEAGLGMFRVEDLASAEFIGRAGLRPEAGTGLPEITYAIRSDRWGIGLGSETARALWRHASYSGITLLVGDVLPANAASQRILAGLGMRLTGQHRHADGQTVLRYEGTPD